MFMVGVIRKRPANWRHRDDARTLDGVDVIPPTATVRAFDPTGVVSSSSAIGISQLYVAHRT